MLDKKFFDGLKDKAQQSIGDIKKEATQLQNKINTVIAEQSLNGANSDLVSNAALNKAAQMLFESSTDQAEKLIYKYFRPMMCLKY